MKKLTLLRLPQWAGEEVQKIADKKGLPFATAAKELICERLREIAPDTPTRAETGTANNIALEG